MLFVEYVIPQPFHRKCSGLVPFVPQQRNHFLEHDETLILAPCRLFCIRRIIVFRRVFIEAMTRTV